MKKHLFGGIITRTFVVLLVAGSTLVAATAAPTVAELQQSFKKVRTAELPATAANLVIQTPSALKAANAVNVVKAAIRVSPGSTLSVVGAVCQVAPEAAAAIVTAAIELQPKLTGAILAAAEQAAPAYRAEILQARVGSPTAIATAASGAGTGRGLQAAGVGDGLRAAGVVVRITPLPPPSTPPTEVKTTDVETYVGRRDYSRP